MKIKLLVCFVALSACKARPTRSAALEADTKEAVDGLLEEFAKDLPLNETTALKLEEFYFGAQKHNSLNEMRVTRIGELYAYGAYSPEVTTYDGGNRDNFEWIYDRSTRDQQRWLSKGLRNELERAMGRAFAQNGRDGLENLVAGYQQWTSLKLDAKPDFLFKHFANSFQLANDYLRVLFLLRTNRSPVAGPKAKQIAGQFVHGWISGLNGPRPPERDEGAEFLKTQLGRLGMSNVFVEMEAKANEAPNRQTGPKIVTAAMIYTQQYRNLVLKEFLKLSSNPDLAKALESTETNLKYMLDNYVTGETETNDAPKEDQISALNYYALASAVSVARDDNAALAAIKKAEKLGPPRYYVGSDNPATNRAASGRWVVSAIAHLAHADAQEYPTVLPEVAKAVDAYEAYLPDLMFHARGRGMHRGKDMLAPYFFHPTVPFCATALDILIHDDSYIDKREHYKAFRDYLTRALLATQREDGTFLSPDIGDVSKSDVAYYAAASWVNPLAGLALLTLTE